MNRLKEKIQSYYSKVGKISDPEKRKMLEGVLEYIEASVEEQLAELEEENPTVDMLKEKIVQINRLVVKKAKEVKVGDIITINYLEYSDSFKVLQLPKTKSTPKSKQGEYVCLVKQD